MFETKTVNTETLSRRNSHAQIKLGDMPSLNRCVRLTYGHHNPLTRGLANCVAKRYADNQPSLRAEANWLIWFNSVDSTAPGEHEQSSGSLKHKQCLGSEVSTSNVGSCTPNIQKKGKNSFLVNQQITGKEKGCAANAALWMNSFLVHEENQHSTVLYRNPDLAYERVVTQSYEVNHLSLRELDNNPEIIEAANRVTISHSVHSVEGYESFVGHRATDSGSVLTSSVIRTKKKGGFKMPFSGWRFCWYSFYAASSSELNST